MSDQLKINSHSFRLVKGDITDLEIESFVYYARNDLLLGAGYGTAISVRGGPTVQEELKRFGMLQTTEAVVSSAGEMKANFIIHAVGPKFQEEGQEGKLRSTILNCLKKAEEEGIKAIAFPAMGVGFYGVPVKTSAAITLKTISEYLSGDTRINDVVVCLLDMREYKPFHEEFMSISGV
ncbi:MAG: macro domain-containing protein [Candidatus Zixiibacteriota bacterium]|nr:MAG: macro domain-containing protein [candidate division Zixibacteria bacterium]